MSTITSLASNTGTLNRHFCQNLSLVFILQLDRYGQIIRGTRQRFAAAQQKELQAAVRRDYDG